MFTSIKEIEAANKRLGHHWFDNLSMRCFRSSVSPYIYQGKYFVSSEKGPDGVRAYTIRIANPDGSIGTVGNFQAYRTFKAARNAARKLK